MTIKETLISTGDVYTTASDDTGVVAEVCKAEDSEATFACLC